MITKFEEYSFCDDHFELKYDGHIGGVTFISNSGTLTNPSVWEGCSGKRNPIMFKLLYRIALIVLLN